jgi:MFS family permease
MSTLQLNQTRVAALRDSRWAPLPIVLVGTFMVVLDFFIVNVALPSMQASLHASDSAIEWVVARLVQGVAGALMMPNVMAIIGVVYTGPDRVRALSVYGMVMGLAAVGGQLLGGVLVQANVAGLGWRSCFLINVPIGLLALALTSSLVPESKALNTRGLDLVGTTLVTVGLAAILLPPSTGASMDGRCGRGCR